MTHSEKIKKDHEARHLSPEQISAEKNARTKARGEVRKAANVARHEGYRAANAKLTPAERLAGLDKAFGKGKGAGKERARLAAAITLDKEQRAKADHEKNKKAAKQLDKKRKAK